MKSLRVQKGNPSTNCLSCLGLLVFLIFAFSAMGKGSAPKPTPSQPAMNQVVPTAAEPQKQTPPSITTPEQNKESAPQSGLVSVVSVVDGDTIKVNLDGKTETLRLIGMDTPEIVDPRKPVQCFAREASSKAKELLSGKKVKLESDSTQGERDKYDRLLRYVYLEDGTLYDKWMITEGFAHEYTYDSNPYRYQADFKAAEKQARDQSKGFWGTNTCNGDTDQAASTTTQPQADTSSQSSSSSSSNTCVIKGNISSSGEKIYHVPGGAYYDATVIDGSKGERWFCSESEAVTAGWRKSKK